MEFPVDLYIRSTLCNPTLANFRANAWHPGNGAEMLDLRRLHLLHELSVLGTISAVAEAAHLTRPAVSQQLTQLGNDLDMVLIERKGRGVQLTPAGLRLVERAACLFHLVEEIEAELAATKVSVCGTIRVSAFWSFASSILPQAFSHLLKQHPQLNLQFVELEPYEGIKAVATKQVDIAIIDDLTNSEFLSNMLENYPLCKDRFELVVSSNHKLANQKFVKLADLSEERWAFEQSADALSRFLLGACSACGFSPKEVSTCRNPAVGLEMVRTGWAVTVLPRLGLRYVENDPDFCTIPFTPTMMHQISGVIMKGTAKRPVITAVLDALKSVIKTKLAE